MLQWIVTDFPPSHAVFLLYMYKTQLLCHATAVSVCISLFFFRLLFLADLCRAQNSVMTRMTAENLAVVFAPGLMASSGTQMSVELMHMENKKRVVVSLILAVQQSVGWS